MLGLYQLDIGVEASRQSWRVFPLILLLYFGVVTGAASAESVLRGLKPVTVTDEHGATVTFTSSRALIVGNSAYTAGWDALAGVQQDVIEVQACLERQGFTVQVARDLNKAQMNETLDTFISGQAQDPSGRVVIYYAGHGHTLGSVGYLVPVDAPRPNEASFRAKAYAISNLKIKAQEAQAKHVLFACDACFSGTLFAPMRGAKDYVLSASREPVRMFLTAGSADETVPDVSFFRQEFVRGIDGAADLNHDGYVTGSELSTYVKQTVTDRAGAMGMKLTPHVGVSEQEGLNRGDIVFCVPQTLGNPTVRARLEPDPPLPGDTPASYMPMPSVAHDRNSSNVLWAVVGGSVVILLVGGAFLMFRSRMTPEERAQERERRHQERLAHLAAEREREKRVAEEVAAQRERDRQRNEAASKARMEEDALRRSREAEQRVRQGDPPPFQLQQGLSRTEAINTVEAYRCTLNAWAKNAAGVNDTRVFTNLGIRTIDARRAETPTPVAVKRYDALLGAWRETLFYLGHHIETRPLRSAANNATTFPQLLQQLGLGL